MSKQKCEQLAKKLNAKIEESGDHILIDAPFRKVWTDSGLHTLVALAERGQRTEAWLELAVDMKAGLTDCVGFCDYCAETYRKEFDR